MFCFSVFFPVHLNFNCNAAVCYLNLNRIQISKSNSIQFKYILSLELCTALKTKRLLFREWRIFKLNIETYHCTTCTMLAISHATPKTYCFILRTRERFKNGNENLKYALLGTNNCTISNSIWEKNNKMYDTNP